MDNEYTGDITIDEYRQLLKIKRDYDLLVAGVFRAAENTNYRNEELAFNIDKLNTILAVLCPIEYDAKVNVLNERKGLYDE